MIDVWESVPFEHDRLSTGASPEDLRRAQAISDGVSSERRSQACTRGRAPPPGVSKVEIDLELRFRGVQGAYVVEGAVVRSANVSDEDLEACLLREYRGLRVPADGVVPGEMRRIRWPILLNVGR